jgi:hypothetical protein
MTIDIMTINEVVQCTYYTVVCARDLKTECESKENDRSWQKITFKFFAKCVLKCFVPCTFAINGR